MSRGFLVPSKADDALAFLDMLPHARHNLVAIDPETARVTGITREASHADLGTFIEQNLGQRNLYFSVNEPRAGAPDDKLRKADIAKLWAVCADLDAKVGDFDLARQNRSQQLADLRHDPNSAPSLAVDTGGGLGLFWLLAEPLDVTGENIDLVEAQGRGIASVLNGDMVQNVDRIMRLPGTINLPDAKKKARGRIAAPAVLLHFDGPIRTLEELAQFAPPQIRAPKTSDEQLAPIDTGLMREFSFYAELPLDLRQRLITLEVEHPAFAHAFAGNFDAVPMEKDTSGSGRIFALAGFLRAGGFTVDEFAQVAWVWPHGHPSGWSEGDDFKIRRDLQRSWAACADSLAVFSAKTKAADDFEPAESEATAPSSRFRFERFEDISTDLRRRHLIKGVLLRVCTLGIIGQPGTGKSQLAAHMAYSIAAGIPWCGRKVEQGAVICSLGEGAEGFRGRVQALRQLHDGPPIPFLIVPAAPNLLVLADVREFILACKLEMAGLNGMPLRMVCVDTLTAATPGGDQNSTEVMSRVVAALRLISHELDCVAAVIHHVGKDQTRGARGSSVFNGDLDTELTVEETGANRFRVMSTKQRDFEKGPPLRFLQRQAVIGQEEDGEDVTAVYAEYDHAPAEDDFDCVDPALSKIAAVRDRIRGGDWAKDVQSPQWVGLAVAEVLELDVNDKRSRERIKGLISAWIADDYLKIAFVRDSSKSRNRPMIVAGSRP